MSPWAASGSGCCWSGQHFRLMLRRIRFRALSQAGVCCSARPGRGGREQRGQELGERFLLITTEGWRMKSIPWAELSNPNSKGAAQPHSATEQSQLSQLGRSEKLPCSPEIIFLQRNEGEKMHSFNARQFPLICQHMVGAIIIWLEYKASLRLFFCFSSLTILLWNLGEILWILLSFSIVPW